METLLEAHAADPVGKLLELLRVRSTVYCRSVMRAPWGFGVVARPVAGFHLVTQGSGWLEVDGESRIIPLAAGDLVILPRGSAHQVRSDPAASVRLLDDILAEHPVPDGRLFYSAAPPTRSIPTPTLPLKGQGKPAPSSIEGEGEEKPFSVKGEGERPLLPVEWTPNLRRMSC